MARSDQARINGRLSQGPKNPRIGTLRENNPTKFAEKFWEKTKRAESGCLEWTGCFFTNKEYGRVNSGGKFLRSNRVAWELSNGPIPEGLHVRHTCDNPKCVDPKHLLLGTHQDNMHDATARNRWNPERGVDRYNAKLDPEKVREIRSLLVMKTKAEIARMFGVNNGTISNIASGKRWKHVDCTPVSV